MTSMSSQDFEKKLSEYVDGTMPATARRDFEEFLRSDPARMERAQALTTVDKVLRAEQLAEPSQHFTARVMANLHRTFPQRISYRGSLWLLGGVIMLVVISVALLSTGIFEVETTIDPNRLNLVKEYVPTSLPSFGFDWKLFINGFIFLNLVVALLVFDKAILKPFFQRRVATGA